MTDQRTPEAIERQIEQERMGLSNTLDELNNRFSIDGIVNQISDQFRHHGGEIGESVLRSVKENPAALALTGVGLAWMMFGSNKRVATYRGRDPYPEYAEDRGRSDRRSQGGYDDGPYSSYSAASRHYDRNLGRGPEAIRPNDTPEWIGGYDDPYAKAEGRADGRSVKQRARELYDVAGNQMSDGADAAAHTASGAADGFKGAARRAGDVASNAASAVSDTAGATKGAITDAVRDTGQTVAERATQARARLAAGTEAMTDEARDRVIAAREKAVEARDAAAEYGRRGRDKAADFYDEQPLVAGALALAVGAAIAAALPRTQVEDHYMGSQSDTLIEEAERIFAEEKAKVGEVARAAMDEAKDVADEAAEKIADVKSNADQSAPSKNAVQAVADKVAEGGKRVANAAASEADEQSLGKPSI
ncbi:DUF3618 domain-containing protein [Pseudoruegeria sp. SK021]|uniref:DUF3618 domain-containing protein n=1 Tax=Pseudoruegeria sp. SK021 TaxID=1933035 RepID=UPI000A23B8FE|nr:DUF3618 domain-containing protein [Pseudoruegeria sp. SK021]OSP52954.1 hypothetical protein BV911_18340 [Pseudoruegeria sp. SK021]